MGGGGKADVRTPPAYELAGYGSQEEWDAAKKKQQDQADELARKQQEFYDNQTSALTEQNSLFSQSLEAQKAALAEAQAKRDAEESAMAEKTRKRLALAGKDKPTLLTGGQGITTAAPVLKKQLGA